MGIIGLRREQPLVCSRDLLEECEHIPYYIGLNVVVSAVRQEVCYSSRAKSIVRREVLPDDGDCFFDVGIL